MLSSRANRHYSQLCEQQTPLNSLEFHRFHELCVGVVGRQWCPNGQPQGDAWGACCFTLEFGSLGSTMHQRARRQAEGPDNMCVARSCSCRRSA